MNREAMLAPFAEEEIRQFEGRGGKTMTYIEDETVMDRLDAGYGPGNWQLSVEPITVADGIVKVTLSVLGESGWVSYQDFGYPNREGGETLKEAVSDGIRRCGRFVGIARDLYRKSTYEAGGARGPQGPAQTRQNAPQKPAAAREAPRPHLVDTDVTPPEPEELDALFAEPTVRADLVRCPIHDVAWIGTPGDLYHRKGEGGFCRHPDNLRKAR